MKLLDLVDPKCIIAELASTDRNGAIKELTQCLSAADILPKHDVDKVVKSILSRERSRGTTGFGKGVALPHAKIEGLERAVAAIGRSSKGLDYPSHDSLPVFGVFLVLSPPEPPEIHLKAMELMYKHLLQEKFRKFLRQSTDSEKIFELLREADERAFV
ncbi:MAG: PTS sugar transporter subunit IIA [Planctomycetes bacterium]|nr:PTS sugar transporter subunit IIA [Planctomycetota bacterium]